MDVLWRDRAPAAAANNLHQAVHVARRALDAGRDRGARRGAARSSADVDVDRLELAAADARRAGTAAAYRAALALYGGELLPENRYDDWAVEPPRRAGGRWPPSSTEELAALGAGGRAARAAGRRELVRRPRARARRAARAARAHAPAHARRDRRRGQDAARARARARAPRRRTPDGAALVELAAVADPRLVPDAVAAALDVRALPGQDARRRASSTSSRRARCCSSWTTASTCSAASAALADTLLRAAPRLTILATSREPLRVAGEVVFRVPSLEIPDPEQPLAPDELLGYEAVRLFVERAAAAAPGFALDEENAADVARICFRLDGLPLALELAAGRLGALGPAAIAERLDDRFRLLAHRQPRGADAAADARRRRSSGATTCSSRTSGCCFRRLAVFAGGFELRGGREPSAPATASTSRAVADVLARLVEKSLVAADEGGRERRYRLLETVRLYARERLDEAGETAALAGRHAALGARARRARARLAAARPRGGEPARRARHAARARAARRAPLLRRALAVLAAPHRARRGAAPLRRRARGRARSARRCAPRRCSPRRRSTSAAARSRAGIARAEESHAVAAEIGDARAEWRALQFLGEFGVASDAADVAVPLARARRSSSRGARASRAAEAIGVYSLGVAHWIRGDLARRRGAPGRRASSSSARSPARPSGSRRRSTSPRSARASPAAGPACASSSRTRCSRSSRSRATRPSATCSRTWPAIARARGDLARARALLDESGRAVRGRRTTSAAGRTVLVRRALPRARRGLARRRRARCLEQALAAAAAAGRPARRSGSCSPGSG